MDAALSDDAQVNVVPERRGRGRPRKNPEAPSVDVEPTIKRPRGRPKGSGKPKPPVEKKPNSTGRGRPKGSKNRPKVPGAIPLASEKAKSRARVGRPPIKKDKVVAENTNEAGLEDDEGVEGESGSAAE